MRKAQGKAGAKAPGAEADVANLRQLIDDDINDMEARLALALTIGSSQPLQADLRRFAGLAPEAAFAARLPETPIWVLVPASGAAGPVRRPPAGVARIEAEAALQAGGALRRALLTASEVVGAFRRAFELLSPVFDGKTPRRRAGMAELIRWTPTFEHLAVRVSARAAMLTDALRRDVVAGLDRPDPDEDLQLSEYTNLVRATGDLQLMVADAGARPWLLDMVRSFEWRRWTPSWPLMRERLAGVTPAATWTVAAIGPDITQDYLDALVRGDHLLLILDALFGLIALAQASPADAAAISREIAGRRAFARTPLEAEAELVTWLVGAAGRVIAAPEIFKRQLAVATSFRGASESGQLLPHVLNFARSLDPADPLQGVSAPLVFALTPVILSGDRADAYLDAGPDLLPVDAMARALRRAWGASPPRRMLN